MGKIFIFTVFNLFCLGFVTAYGSAYGTTYKNDIGSDINDDFKRLKSYEFKLNNNFLERKKRYESEISRLEKLIEKEEIRKNSLLSVENKADLMEKKFLEKVRAKYPYLEISDDISFEDNILNIFKQALNTFETDVDGKHLLFFSGETGLYKGNGESGYVLFRKGRFEFYPEKGYENEIEAVISDKDADAGRELLLKMKTDGNYLYWIMDYVEKGGVMIYPILAVAFLAFIFTLVQAVILFKARRPDEDMEREFFEGLKSDLFSYLSKIPDFVCYPSFYVILKSIERSKNSLDPLEFMDTFMERAEMRLEKYLSTLAIFAGVAPLLGLLGTVTGMIKSFGSMGGYDAVNTVNMAKGISEALITTQVGLVVAVPIMVVHHFFSERVKALVADMEEKKNIFKALSSKK